jgi:hypothetical protein
MIQFTVTDFYEDISFMALLFYHNRLDNKDIYNIASHLNNKTYHDILNKIIANGADNDNNKKLFEYYLNVLGIKFLDLKRALVAKVFYYILYDIIDFYDGIRFAHRKISNRENITKYIGDDIGIERILGNFYLIDDGDLRNEEDIVTVIESIIVDIKQYVNDYLVNFPMDNNISKDNEKTVIKTESEKRVKIKALAKGIQIKNYWVEEYEKRQTAHNKR